MVAALDIASGRERLDRAKRSRPRAGAGRDGGGRRLAARSGSGRGRGRPRRRPRPGPAAVCQTIFVTVSRDGYRRSRPTRRRRSSSVRRSSLASSSPLVDRDRGGVRVPVHEPGRAALLLFTGLFAAALPSLGFLIGIRVIGGMRAGILDAVRAGRRRGPGGPPAERAAAADPAGRVALAILAAAVILQRSAAGDRVTPMTGRWTGPSRGGRRWPCASRVVRRRDP